MGDEPIRMMNIARIHETGEQDGQPYFFVRRHRRVTRVTRA